MSSQSPGRRPNLAEWAFLYYYPHPLYSFVETVKANGLDPYAYLRHVFTRLPQATSLQDIEALLPTRLDPQTLRTRNQG